MLFTRPQAALILGILALGAIPPHVTANSWDRYTLNPKTYKSPSGEYELHVDPSTIYGQGEGHYRMTRKGAEVWAKALPFTLWDAGVTDQGIAAGYAYSLGRENKPLQPLGSNERSDEVVGQLCLVIIDPQGKLRMNEILPRKGMDSCETNIDRNVTGFILDPKQA